MTSREEVDLDINYYVSKGRPAVRYASGSSVYEECLQDGRFIGLYWSSAGQAHRENLVDQIPEHAEDTVRRRLNSFDLEIDSQLLENRWEYVGGMEQRGKNDTLESVITLKHKVRPVTVKVITGLDGSPVLVRRLEVTNTGVHPAAIGAVCPFAGRLWDNLWQHTWEPDVRIRFPFDIKNKPFFSIGYYEGSVHDTRMLGLEGNFIWEPVKSEYFVISRLERKPYSAPFFIIKNNLTGECFPVSLEWSAGYELRLWYDKLNCSLCMSLGPAGPAPLRVVEPGETVITPAVHFGPMHGEIDNVVSEWYSHLRASVLPKRPHGKEMFTMAARVVEDTGDWILREVDIASDMGVEAFMVDSGWYGERGDWIEHEYLPKGGLAAIREYIHGKGMLFGLWMEPESISLNSKLYAEHPDWHLVYDGEYKSSAGKDGMLNLSKPEVANFVRTSVLDLIGTKKPDFFKIDFNVDYIEGGRHEIAGYAENESWRHYECIYGVFNEVLDKYPNVALENCASGGGRNDLGMLSCFHYAAQSDWSVFPFSIRAINGLTLFLPPETLCYYHNHIHFASQMTDIDTHLRVILFCSPIFIGYGGQNANRDTIYFQKTREYTELFKSFCRPVITKATVFHHTPDIGVTEPAEWCVLEYTAENSECGYVGLFRLGDDAAFDEYTLRLRGVAVNKTYEVTTYNDGSKFVIQGAELIRTGLNVRLSSVNSSELILYTELKEHAHGWKN